MRECKKNATFEDITMASVYKRLMPMLIPMQTLMLMLMPMLKPMLTMMLMPMQRWWEKIYL